MCLFAILRMLTVVTIWLVGVYYGWGVYPGLGALAVYVARDMVAGFVFRNGEGVKAHEPGAAVFAVLVIGVLAVEVASYLGLLLWFARPAGS